MPVTYSYDGDIVASYDIVNAMVISEYNLLTDAQKDRIKIYLSCGFVNFREGTNSRIYWLTTCFPEGSTIYTNIMDIIKDSVVTP